MKKTMFVTAAAVLMSAVTIAQDNSAERIGDMKVAKFNEMNEKGNRKVMAITPSGDAATETDKTLMTQVALGGMRQLMISQAVVAKVTNPKVKMLAQSEVEEQTGVSAKLKEIAAAKGVTLPAEPDAETQQLVSQVQNLSDAQLDQFYLSESGVKGHQLLQTTMTTVSSTANDKSLRQLATATLPVIRMHLSVSEKELAKGNNTTAATP